ncbi:pilin [Legionella spiritensis]|uniref:Type IV pilus assembly protein PilA n=1 Tax=Legionella spiritensis TaxID=452 RepID=A0A0W0Z9P0_LEGSP|nr:pilin [Legionella spiritensis]KTD65651.1 type IV pilus assembly protein PilA [Legionella spiritensis]SNV43742.1 type IV pilus assembly protein PilA [Legionella spiritensis]
MAIKGFTLIEFMIVVAIIAILVVIAIPFLQTYLIRARVSEGLELVAPAKLAVTETAINTNVLPASQAQTGYVSPAATSYVNSIIIDPGGVITITYTATAGGGTIIFMPTLQGNGDMTWDCSGGTLSDQYRPVNCR